jgi:hypothetical protein
VPSELALTILMGVSPLVAVGRSDPAQPGSSPASTVSATVQPSIFQRLSGRGWAKLVKAPDRYIGKRYRVWACISQFDAATGPDTFRGQASFRKEPYWWLSGDNALFTGSESQLERYVTDDIVVMGVISLGSISYDTQIGGSTTVPLFEVVTIARLRGSC